MGTVDLVPSASGYRLSGTLQGLPAGVHGIHLHMVGVCDAPEFTSAGGHLNPAGRKHGALNPAGAHLGDLPNITASADGLAQLNVELPGSRTDLDRDLFDHDGTALVAHAIADDYLTDPSGNSGSRVACGVLKRG
ncbi:MAG: superoxide dismutase family protein [Pseudomonadota bacterium]